MESLRKMTMKELKVRAKDLGAKGYSRMKKAELMTLVFNLLHPPSEEKALSSEEETPKDGPASIYKKAPFPSNRTKSITLPISPLSPIYHMADLHIVGTKFSFEHLLSFFAESEKGVIVIVGDVLHQYDSLSTPLIKSLFHLFETLISFGHFILVIEGNHDVLNPKTQNSFLRVLCERVSGAYHLLPGILYALYTKDNGRLVTNMFHIPFWGDPFAVLTDEDNVRFIFPTNTIALFHDTVRGAIVGRRFIIEGNDYSDSNELFSESAFSLALLGHIHSRQFISNSLIPAYYAGSLSQLNFGEKINNHGVSIWRKLEPRSMFEMVSFVEIYAPQLFLIVPTGQSPKEALLNSIAQDDWENRKRYIKTIHFRFEGKVDKIGIDSLLSETNAGQIGKVIGDYGFFNSSPTFDEDSCKDDAVPFEDDVGELILLEKYLAKFLPDPSAPPIPGELVKKVTNLHKQLRAEAVEATEQIAPARPWQLRQIKFKNMFTYGNDEIQTIFVPTNSNTITHIVGKNGTGKSNILLIILFALFGNRAMKPRAVLHKGAEEFMVEIELTIGKDTQFVIQKNGKKRGKEVRVTTFLSVNGKSISQRVNYITKYIEQTIGDYHTFLLSNVFSARIGINFSDLTGKGKVDMLSELLGLSILSDTRKMVMKKERTSKDALNVYRGQHEELIRLLNATGQDGLGLSVNGKRSSPKEPWSEEKAKDRVEKIRAEYNSYLDTQKESAFKLDRAEKELANLANIKLFRASLEDEVRAFHKAQYDSLSSEIETAKKRLKIAKLRSKKRELSELKDSLSDVEQTIKGLKDEFVKSEIKIDNARGKNDNLLSEKRVLGSQFEKVKTAKHLVEMRAELRRLNGKSLVNDINKFVDDDSLFPSDETRLVRKYYYDTRENSQYIDVRELSRKYAVGKEKRVVKLNELGDKIKAVDSSLSENAKDIKGIQENLNELRKKKTVAESERETLKTRIDKLQKRFANFGDDIDGEKDIDETCELARIEKGTNSLETIVRTMNMGLEKFITSESAKDSFISRWRELVETEKKRDSIKLEIDTEKRTVGDLNLVIASKRIRLEQSEEILSKCIEYKGRLDSLSEQIKTEKEKCHVFEIYKKVMAFKEFPSYLMNSRVKVIMARTCQLLSNVGSSLSVQSNGGQLSYSKADKLVKFSVSVAGNYEMLAINLAIKIVLQKINKGSTSQLLFIDEGLDSVGEENVTQFSSLLSDIGENRTTFLITHSKRFAQIRTNVIEVCEVKNAGYSFIKR